MNDNDIKKTFSYNLRYYIGASGKTQREVAEALGVKESTFSTWCTGDKIPRMGKIEMLAQYFGIEKSDLLEPKSMADIWFERNAIPMRKQRLVPVVGVIRAGIPMFAEENLEGFEPAEVTNPSEYFYLRVTGDSMINAGIYDGSLVLIRRQDCAEDGQIVVCLVNGEDATLKRFKRSQDKVALLPENKDYSPILLSCQDFETGYAKVLGVAVEVRTKL